MFTNKILPYLFIALLSLSNLHAQNVQLNGKILDSLDQGIANTNLIASPLADGENITFAIANQKGEYQLKLKKDISYKIEITSLGFAAFTDTLKISEDTHKNFYLKESFESLEQVVVKAKMAMVINEDTITYRTDKFRTGDERKLREVLKKLPGVEVDREGNVTVNGKKVSKLMVDGKEFFGGDTKLGVNNIPADAVEEVEAIDNYNEVSFMKGLSDSDKMAMNIKLKKDKKDFWFGENEIGGGVKKRYSVQPRIFYYSPKTTLNFIGSLNNVNESPLDFQDVMRFKGGYMSFLDNAIRSSDDGLTRFSTRSDTRHKKMQFGAANFTQEINKKTRLDAYSIIAKQEVHSENRIHTEYLTQQDLIEDRETRNKDRGFSNFNKLKLRHIPNNSKDLAYDMLVNLSNNRYDNNILSQVLDSINQTDTRRDPHDLEINQFFRYNAQPSYEHTSEVKAEYTFKKSNRLTNWDFDRPIFSDIIPILEDGTQNYKLSENYNSSLHSANASYKHYWVVNNLNHLYPIVGLYFFDQSYQTEDYQSLANGDRNSLADAGFNNDLHYQLWDPYIGFQYKFKIGEFIFRPGLIYHHYFWRVDQFQERIADKNKAALLPEFKLEYKVSSSRKFEFNYNLKSTFADAEKYANRLSLRSFNQLYLGNSDLGNSLYHNMSFAFNNFSLMKGLTYYMNLNYRRQEKSVTQSTVLEGIDQISTVFYNNFPENQLSLNGYLLKRWRKISTSLRVNSSLSDYSRIVNDEKLDYDSQNLGYMFGISSRFKKGPNFEVGLSQQFYHTKSDNFKNDYNATSPFLDLSYVFLRDFTLKAYYEYNHTSDKTSARSENFQIAKASLFYKKEDSPWGFEVRVDNLFDVQYKRSHSVDEFMVYDRKVYIQPRTALLTLSYQL